MNYRHAYHAGNFADVIKHVMLVALIQSLMRKESPFCYIDTHAGAGCYDLFSDSAKKNREYENGIEKIIQQENPPPVVKQYLYCIHSINNQMMGSHYASLRHYAGSPLIVRQLIRPMDRIIACELHLEEYQALKKTFAGDRQVAAHHTDGFQALKAFLPPHERRGLILIDPPYEEIDEFTHITHALHTALRRFENGTYAIWYPIKGRHPIEKFHQSLLKTTEKPILSIELTIYPDLPSHLNGCGLAVINPPWQFEETVRELLPWLWKALTINNQGAFHAQTLKSLLK